MLRIAKGATLSQHLVGDETNRSDAELGDTEESAWQPPQTTGGPRSVRSAHRMPIPGIWAPMQMSHLLAARFFSAPARVASRSRNQDKGGPQCHADRSL